MTAAVGSGVDQRRRWRRQERIAWLVVALLAVSAFAGLTALADVSPLVAFLGILAALDLPICLDLIWRAWRDTPAVASSPGPVSMDDR